MSERLVIMPTFYSHSRSRFESVGGNVLKFAPRFGTARGVLSRSGQRTRFEGKAPTRQHDEGAGKGSVLGLSRQPQFFVGGVSWPRAAILCLGNMAATPAEKERGRVQGDRHVSRFP